MINYIESSQNKIIKQINGLKLKKERDKTGLFIAEGTRLVKDIGSAVKYIIISEDYKEDISEFDTVYCVSRALFDKISDTVNPQGILAVCEIKNYNIDNAFKKENPFLIILEDISDPGNMGTVIRTCDAGGVDGIILTKGCVDIYNPKVVRSTMGSLFHLPIYRNQSIDGVLKKCSQHNIITISAHLKGNYAPYDVDMTKGCAILIGNEARGLKNSTAEQTSTLVKIPMPGKAESMNAAVAAAILIYEGVRQRL